MSWQSRLGKAMSIGGQGLGEWVAKSEAEKRRQEEIAYRNKRDSIDDAAHAAAAKMRDEQFAFAKETAAKDEQYRTDQTIRTSGEKRGKGIRQGNRAPITANEATNLSRVGGFDVKAQTPIPIVLPGGGMTVGARVDAGATMGSTLTAPEEAAMLNMENDNRFQAERMEMEGRLRAQANENILARIQAATANQSASAENARLRAQVDGAQLGGLAYKQAVDMAGADVLRKYPNPLLLSEFEQAEAEKLYNASFAKHYQALGGAQAGGRGMFGAMPGPSSLFGGVPPPAAKIPDPSAVPGAAELGIKPEVPAPVATPAIDRGMSGRPVAPPTAAPAAPSFQPRQGAAQGPGQFQLPTLSMPAFPANSTPAMPSRGVAPPPAPPAPQLGPQPEPVSQAPGSQGTLSRIHDAPGRLAADLAARLASMKLLERWRGTAPQAVTDPITGRVTWAPPQK